VRLTFWVAVAASPRVLLVAGVDDLAVVVVQIAQRAGAQRGRVVGLGVLDAVEGLDQQHAHRRRPRVPGRRGLQLAEVIRAAERVRGLVLGLVGLPAVMDRGPSERWEHARVIHRLGPAALARGVARQRRRGGGVDPPQAPRDPRVSSK